MHKNEYLLENYLQIHIDWKLLTHQSCWPKMAHDENNGCCSVNIFRCATINAFVLMRWAAFPNFFWPHYSKYWIYSRENQATHVPNVLNIYSNMNFVRIRFDHHFWVCNLLCAYAPRCMPLHLHIRSSIHSFCRERSNHRQSTMAIEWKIQF